MIRAYLRNKLTVWWIRLTTREAFVRRSCGHHEWIRVRRRHAEWRIKTYTWTPCASCRFHESMALYSGRTQW